MSNLWDKENIFNNYGRFYFPKDFYKYKEKKESNVENLDELLNGLKTKLEELEEKLEGIEVSVDIQPLIERIEALELITSILENDTSENETRISFLETTKLEKTDFEEYKELIEAFKSQISSDVSNNKELFDLFKTKVENDLLEVSNILTEIVTTAELNESLEKLKEEILIKIPTSFDPTSINTAISGLQFELADIKVDNTFNKKSIETINSEILTIKQQIQELDIYELNLSIESIEIKVSDLETSISSLLPIKEDLESLKIKVEQMGVKLEGIDFDLFTESLEDINKTVDVLKLHDLFEYWLNLPENMVTNSQGLLEINTLLTLQDFITYLLNDKDYSQKFSEIESLVSELSDKIDSISFEIESIDLASINEEIVQIKNELQEIEVLKGEIQDLTVLFESNNEAINIRIETLSSDITDISNIVASFLDTFYTKQETDLLISPITTELAELTESLSEYYNKLEIDSLLMQIRESIVSSTGVSIEYLEEQLLPINLKLLELESLIESATKVDLTEIEQNISNLQTEVFQLKTNTYTKKQVDDLIAFYIGTGDGNYILRPATDLLLGGVKIGTGLSYQEDGTINVEFPEVEEYVLPKATFDSLGGVILGEEFSYEEDGTIHVKYPVIEEYELPKATEESLGGIKVGSGLSYQEDGTINVEFPEVETYVLPKATTESIGGVIIGDTLEVDENGKIEVKPSSTYELPIATTENIGGIKVGDNLTITEDGVLSATGGGGDSVNKQYNLEAMFTYGSDYVEQIDKNIGYNLINIKPNNTAGRYSFKNKYKATTADEGTKSQEMHLLFKDSWESGKNIKIHIEKENEILDEYGAGYDGTLSFSNLATSIIKKNRGNSLQENNSFKNTTISYNSIRGFIRTRYSQSYKEDSSSYKIEFSFNNASTNIGRNITYEYETNGTVYEKYRNDSDKTIVGKKEIDGHVDVLGDLNVTGEKNAIVPTRKGLLKTPAYETMGAFFGDIQEIEVTEGENIVYLNELFLDATEEGSNYHVFLTAYSDAKVYVSNRNNDSFTIISDKPTNISYEIKRRRRGFTEDYNLTQHTFEQMKELYPTEKDLLKQYQESLRLEEEREQGFENINSSDLNKQDIIEEHIIENIE